MEKENINWKKLPLQLFLLGVGSLWGYYLPKWLDKGTVITYSVEGPIAYLNEQAGNVLSITVNNVATTQLYAYKVVLKNSGNKPIKQFPVTVNFDYPKPTFQVFTKIHQTVPHKEFGKIDELQGAPYTIKFIYELLNPEDEDTITFLTNDNLNLSVYGKGEGVRLKKGEIELIRKTKTWGELRVGILVLVSLAILIIVIFYISGDFKRKTH